MAEKKPTTKKKATSKKPTTKKEKKEVVETGAMEEFLNANVGKIAKVSKVEDIDGVPTVTIVPDNHLDSIECTLTVMPTDLKGHPDPVGELGVDGDEIDAKVLQEHEELIEGKEEIKPSEPEPIEKPVFRNIVYSSMGIRYD